MAQLVFSELGARIGGALLPGGFDVFGKQFSGEFIGRSLGALAGQAVESALSGPVAEGPRLNGLTLMESREGTGIPRVFGRMRVGGQLIWATHLKEKKSDRRVGGKTGPKVSEYSYSLSFAVALCEGEIAGIDRVWANGEPISLAEVNHRLYYGTETQLPDPLIEAVEGSAPAYRGLVYLVFEDFPLDAYGARLPQLSFEVHRPVKGTERGLSDVVTGVNFIPASGEWVYSPELVRAVSYPGRETPLNRNSASGHVDAIKSLDQLQAELPLVTSINLTLAWFGDDLRCGECAVRPGVETDDAITLPRDWKVAGQTRATAHLISRDAEDRPYYGGTPDDASVLALLAECASRNISVTLSPFLLMDIPPGNGLADPYGAAEQAVFPWRGRVTCHPAIDEVGSVDLTAAARTQVEAFFGTASAGDFALVNDQIVYSGPAEWSYRRFVLHLAMLGKAAGTIEKFLLGSELVGMTRVRDETGAFPAVDELCDLAAEVRAILGSGVEISYAADWTEYGAYVPGDGSGDVLFPLDPLWGDANTDFVGIDWYAPLSDWRDGAHLDAAVADAITDPDYLSGNVEGGEGYDWYYASESDRDAQVRTSITDTAHGEDWVFRVKDLKNWWGNAHYERPLGVRAVSPTAWVAEEKPIRLIEIGCGAVEKGTNAPNVFVDPKSSESALPPFSNGTRDDEIQAAAIMALADYWSVSGGNNPVSGVYAGPMIPVDGLSVWAWDARPFPAFPLRTDVWSDGANWQLGHWLNGRVTRSDLSAVITEICGDAGVSVSSSDVRGSFHGFLVSGVTTLKEAIDPLAAVFGLDWRVDEGGLIASNQQTSAVKSISSDDLALTSDRTNALRTVRPLTEHNPETLRLTLLDPDADYQPATRQIGLEAEGDRAVHVRLPMALEGSQAEALATHMSERLAGDRTRHDLLISPARTDLRAGDRVTLPGVAEPLKVTALNRAGHFALSLSEPIESFAETGGVAGEASPPAHTPRPDMLILDLPGLPGREEDIRPLIAVSSDPWPGRVIIEAGVSSDALSVRGEALIPAQMGTLQSDLQGGASDRWRPGLTVEIYLPDGEAISRTKGEVLNGANLIAIETASRWMICAFETADLIATDTWRLSGLLTGLFGTDDAAMIGASTGARCVLLDDALVMADLAAHELGQSLLWRATGPGMSAESVETEQVITGEALQPWRPGHLRAKASSSGDIALSWTRRARHSADRWDLPSVPLLEEQMAFRVEVLDGESLLRTEEVGDTGWTYTSAMQADDGYVPGEFTFEVSQLSAMAGAGAKAVLGL